MKCNPDPTPKTYRLIVVLFDHDGLPSLHSGGRYKLSLFNSESVFLSNIRFSGIWFERTVLYTLLSRAVGRYVGAHAHIPKRIDASITIFSLLITTISS